MVNFQDPATIAGDYGAYAFLSGFRLQVAARFLTIFSTVALVKFWHVVNGIFM